VIDATLINYTSQCAKIFELFEIIVVTNLQTLLKLAIIQIGKFVLYEDIVHSSLFTKPQIVHEFSCLI
jgi:hypothetical protein